MADLVPPPSMVQGVLYEVEKQTVIDGVEMGVLQNGIPYLSESGLARMCGVDRKALNRMAINWPSEKQKSRGAQINAILQQSGYDEPTLFLRSSLNGSSVNAYTEPVCLALLEYYAYEAEEPKPEALRAFRTLAKQSFRQFVYTATGYSPRRDVINGWRHYHDRVDMVASSVPTGYFGIFHEIAIMIVPMIKAGVIISDNVVPDISVGKMWSQHWSENGLSEKYGERIKYDHEYPLYYPQAKSNPQPSFAYPEMALGEFRQWLRDTYITANFPKYILTKAKQGALPATTAQQVIETFMPKLLTE